MSLKILTESLKLSFMSCINKLGIFKNIQISYYRKQLEMKNSKKSFKKLKKSKIFT